MGKEIGALSLPNQAALAKNKVVSRIVEAGNSAYAKVSADKLDGTAG